MEIDDITIYEVRYNTKSGESIYYYTREELMNLVRNRHDETIEWTKSMIETCATAMNMIKTFPVGAVACNIGYIPNLAYIDQYFIGWGYGSIIDYVMTYGKYGLITKLGDVVDRLKSRLDELLKTPNPKVILGASSVSSLNFSKVLSAEILNCIKNSIKQESKEGLIMNSFSSDYSSDPSVQELVNQITEDLYELLKPTDPVSKFRPSDHYNFHKACTAFMDGKKQEEWSILIDEMYQLLVMYQMNAASLYRIREHADILLNIFTLSETGLANEISYSIYAASTIGSLYESMITFAYRKDLLMMEDAKQRYMLMLSSEAREDEHNRWKIVEDGNEKILVRNEVIDHYLDVKEGK